MKLNSDRLCVNCIFKLPVSFLYYEIEMRKLKYHFVCIETGTVWQLGKKLLWAENLTSNSWINLTLKKWLYSFQSVLWNESWMHEQCVINVLDHDHPYLTTYYWLTKYVSVSGMVNPLGWKLTFKLTLLLKRYLLVFLNRKLDHFLRSLRFPVCLVKFEVKIGFKSSLKFHFCLSWSNLGNSLRKRLWVKTGHDLWCWIVFLFSW